MSQVKTLPKCFSDVADHVVWLTLDQRAVNNGSRESTGFVCKDCNPDFQYEMMLQDRCEHPEVKFGYISRKFGKHVETEFTGYVQGPRGKLTNEYITNTTKSEVVAG